MHSSTKILLIEDNRSIATALSQALAGLYEVDIAPTGTFGLYRTAHEVYGAILLDLNLPDLSGLEVCEQLRSRGVKTPILVLTAEAAVLSKIKLLDSGANDYLTKPFSLGELKARLRALMRVKDDWQHRPEQLSVNGLSLEAASRLVTRNGQSITLRPKEFAILECLMLRAGNVVSRDILARYAWRAGDETWTNTIDVHIKHLRDKVDRPFEQQLIKTVHGMGYRLETAIDVATITDPELVHG